MQLVIHNELSTDLNTKKQALEEVYTSPLLPHADSSHNSPATVFWLKSRGLNDRV